jgi:hypothetical protein
MCVFLLIYSDAPSTLSPQVVEAGKNQGLSFDGGGVHQESREAQAPG